MNTLQNFIPESHTYIDTISTEKPTMYYITKDFTKTGELTTVVFQPDSPVSACGEYRLIDTVVRKKLMQIVATVKDNTAFLPGKDCFESLEDAKNSIVEQLEGKKQVLSAKLADIDAMISNVQSL